MNAKLKCIKFAECFDQIFEFKNTKSLSYSPRCVGTGALCKMLLCIQSF